MFRTFIKLFLGKGVLRSYSQDAEDLLAGIYLREPRGTYVDIGAYHPVLYSNTYAFYRRGWKGVVIDPNIQLRPLYKVFRSRDIFFHAAVGKVAGTETYFRFSDGAYNTLVASEAEKTKQKKNLSFLGEESVAVRPLSGIVREAGITTIDFMTIDVEGMEMEVLESHDWNIPPRLIAIEDNAFSVDMPKKSPVYTYLTGKGYALSAFAPRTLIFTR